MDTTLSSLNLPPTTSGRRRALYSLVASTCLEVGFQAAETSTLDTLLQMMQAFIIELSFMTKQYCEHSGRTEPLSADVMMSLIDLGFDVKSLPAYAFRQSRIIVPPPSLQQKHSSPKILHTGENQQLHNFIPDSFPQFPDSHSYISTPTYKQPITDYETLREKSSSHKRDVERGLTRFMARTFSSPLNYSLFPDEQLSHLFPLIGIKNDPVPYLSALLPKDQIWEEAEENSLNTDDAKKSKDSSKDKVETEDQAMELDASKDNNDENITINDAEICDNPYLRPAKIVNGSRFVF